MITQIPDLLLNQAQTTPNLDKACYAHRLRAANQSVPALHQLLLISYNMQVTCKLIYLRHFTSLPTTR